MKKHSGFTLIELMVVMAIIAILATAGLTAYSNYLKKARDSSRLQVARQIMTAVESLANGGPLPTASALDTYLTNEGFAYTLPTMNPLVARVSGVVDNILGTALAVVDIDPLKGASVCLGDVNALSGVYNSRCAFSYTNYPDGTYTIMYGIEHEDNKSNFWKADHNNGLLWGEVIGTNPYIVLANTGVNGNNEIESILEELVTQNLTDSGNSNGYLPYGGVISDMSAYVCTDYPGC